jgi:uncharacterized protein YciW
MKPPSQIRPVKIAAAVGSAAGVGRARADAGWIKEGEAARKEAAQRRGGRHRNFKPETAKRLIAVIEPHARKRMSKLGQRPTRNDPELMRVVHKLIAVEGIDSSDKVIQRQLIAPVLRKLRVGSE